MIDPEAIDRYPCPSCGSRRMKYGYRYGGHRLPGDPDFCQECGWVDCCGDTECPTCGGDRSSGEASE